MRGIMSARTKPLQVIEAAATEQLSKINQYQTPAPRSAVKMIEADDVKGLVDLLHSEAKVI